MTRLPGLGPKRARRLFDELGHRLAGGAARGGRGRAPARRARASARSSRRACSPSLEAGAGEAAAPARAARPGARRRRGDRRRAARAPGRRPRRAGRLGPAPGRRGQGPRHHRHGLRPARRCSPRSPSSTSSSRASAPASNAARARRTHTGLAVDLRVVAPDQFGNLLQHFTGSKQHNMALREAAVRRGLHVSEYGVLDDATGETHRCATEERGLRAARPAVHRARAAREPRRARLPRRRRRRARRASRTCAATCTATRSPPTARNTIEEMARAALERGYEYLAITDHSATHGFGDDVTPDELRAPDRARARGSTSASRDRACSPAPRSNILPDGSLDYDDELLAAARLGDRLGPHVVPHGRGRR